MARIRLSNGESIPIDRDANELVQEIIKNETIPLKDGSVLFTKHILYVDP
jgi:hypothetical protein